MSQDQEEQLAPKQVGLGTRSIERLSHADFAVKVRVTTTLFCAMAMLARLGGWMPKSVMYMVLVAVPVIVLPTTFPCMSKTSLLVLPCMVRLPVS